VKKPFNDLGTTRNIYKFGIVKTTHNYNEDGIGYTCSSVNFELNRIEDKTYYGFVAGIDTKGLFFDLGLNFNYITDFGNSRALAIRPQFGISFFHSFNLDAIVGYDIYPIKANFDYVSHWTLGLQYTIGIIEYN
jgi:hypothetical protein